VRTNKSGAGEVKTIGIQPPGVNDLRVVVRPWRQINRVDPLETRFQGYAP
jgi:hypothetical protein